MTASVLQAVFNDDGLTGALGTTIAATLTVTAGSILHVFTMWEAGTASCSDNVNGSYGTALDLVNDVPSGQNFGQFRFENAAAGSTTVTVTLSPTTDFKGICVVEIAGCKTSSALDGHTGQVQPTPGTGTDGATSGSASNSIQPAIIVGLTVSGPLSDTATPSVGTGFTSNGTGWANGSAIQQGRAESKRITSTGAQAATFTVSDNVAHTTFIAIYDELLVPSIDVPPQQQFALSGSTATFNVSATTSGGTLHYQWKLNGSNVGTDSSSYATSTLSMSDDASYVSVVVTDNNASVTSVAVALHVKLRTSWPWVKA